MAGEKPPDPQSNPAQATAATPNLPFTAEALLTHWKSYAETLKAKIHLKNAMQSCKPVLQENDCFEAAVLNPGQQDELANNASDILAFLRRELKNTNVQMRVRVTAETSGKLPVTSAEKYEYLTNINPLLKQLREEFSLSTD
ncbi:DNA polymerase III subunits gamma and tau [Bacteroidales bacterium Barb6XT]|nr:DNA polymerase III subunits gamma and tau [Bacteroidales bacterium Barb6XT]